MKTEQNSVRFDQPQVFSADKLTTLLPDGPAEAVNQEFDNWFLVIGSLPLTTSDYGFAHGWVTSAKQLWEQGDVHTARYQLNQVARRLEL